MCSVAGFLLGVNCFSRFSVIAAFALGFVSDFDIPSVPVYVVVQLYQLLPEGSLEFPDLVWGGAWQVFLDLLER